MRFRHIKLCMNVLLGCLVVSSCNSMVDPSVTDSDLDITSEFVQLSSESTNHPIHLNGAA